MASFQAKISQEKLGKSKKKKKIVLMSSYLTRNREFQKNSKKIPKIEKKPFWLLFKPKKFRNGRKWEKIKKNHSDQFLPDLEQRITKNSKKI